MVIYLLKWRMVKVILVDTSTFFLKDVDYYLLVIINQKKTIFTWILRCPKHIMLYVLFVLNNEKKKTFKINALNSGLKQVV